VTLLFFSGRMNAQSILRLVFNSHMASAYIGLPSVPIDIATDYTCMSYKPINIQFAHFFFHLEPAIMRPSSHSRFYSSVVVCAESFPSRRIRSTFVTRMTLTHEMTSFGPVASFANSGTTLCGPFYRKIKGPCICSIEREYQSVCYGKR
jgi:hypothetical protein